MLAPGTMDARAIYAIEKPDRKLWLQYLITGLLTGPLSPLAVLLLWFRYHSMRYRFDEHGVTKSWGVLAHREINLTYARIQDIHLRSGPIQRWLGLADIDVQTASASAGAELTIEGVLDPEAVRDFLYAKMRGVHAHDAPHADAPAAATADAGEAATLLREIRDDVRAARLALEASHVSAPAPAATEASDG